MAALKRWRGTESRWRLDGSMCKFTYFTYFTWNRKPMTCLRGIAGFQVLLSSWGKGHRQAVFTPVAQQVAVESRKTLEADPQKKVYLTVQIVHCTCLKDLDISKSDDIGTFRTCKKAIPCYTLYLHPLTHRTCACICAIGSRTGSMKPPENLCPWANWSRDLSPNFFRFPCGNVRAVSKETCSCTPG